MNREARLDEVTPVDESWGSEAYLSRVVKEARIPVLFTSSNYDVASPPTDAELTAAFGHKSKGFAAIVFDDGGTAAAYFCVKGPSGTWWYEALTKAT